MAWATLGADCLHKSSLVSFICICLIGFYSVITRARELENFVKKTNKKKTKQTKQNY